MANLGTVPDQFSFNLIFDITAGICSGIQAKLVPTNPDGTIFDCTGLSGATMQVNSPSPTAPDGTITQVMTLGTADTTGVIVKLTETQANNLAIAMLTGSSQAAITATDGTNISLIGQGSVNLTVYN